MAPPAGQARVTMDAAQTHATGQQDSQLVAMIMHRHPGIGTRSSSPVDPLDSDDDYDALYHRTCYQPRPRKVRQRHLGQPPTETAAAARPRAKRAATDRADLPAVNVNVHVNVNVCADGDGDSDGDVTKNSKGLPGPVPGPAASLVDHGPTHDSPGPGASPQRVSSSPPSQLFATGTTQPLGLPTDATIAASLSAPLQLCVGHEAIGFSVEHATRHNASLPILHTYSKRIRRRTRRVTMSFSQGSTQSNPNRSYEQYDLHHCDGPLCSDASPLPISRPSLSSQLSHPETGTSNHDDDTGPIHIDFSALARDTQVSLPDSPATRTTSHQEDASPGYLWGPETPAPPRNPFGRTKAAGLMGSSQMFRQTQYSSAIKHAFSPTSSRPSPDNFRPNPVSPNPSPLKHAAFAPSPLPEPSSLPRTSLAVDTSPQHPCHDPDDDDHDDDDNNIATSNIAKSLRSWPQAPLETYKPVMRWEDRVQSSQSASDLDHESDDDMTDVETRRRRRVASKRAQSKRRLEAITLRPSDDAVVPSTNKETTPAAKQYFDQHGGVSRRDPQSSIQNIPTQDRDDEIVDSQEGISQNVFVPPSHRVCSPPSPTLSVSGPDEVISSNDVVPNTDPGPQSASAVARVVATDDDGSSAQIPETSPARLRAVDDMAPGSPLPVPASMPPQQPVQHAMAVALAEAAAVNDMRESIMVSSSPPAPALSTRARARRLNAPPIALPTSSSTSPLSRLTTTPVLSDTTPQTEESLPRSTSPSTSTNRTGSSPAGAKARRQQTKAAVRPMPNMRASTRRTTRRLLPSDISVSTDELARSPTSTANLGCEQSTRANSRGGAKIFAGMVFAISFQGKQPDETKAQYSARMAASSHITIKVKQGGGRVLSDGFDQLFEFSPVKNADRQDLVTSSTPQPHDDITLAPAARQTAFTALIADGHSRKVKYMQALALGLPCIHERWITTCVDKGRLVNWSDYLLCAGFSSFLGNAIKSRNLQSYDAATAKLSEVIEYRPRLLDQSRILLLMPRAEETKKGAYMFLARVLGASLSRVYTVEEARVQLKAREEAGKPFNWLYVVDDKVAAADILASPPQLLASKKRKRQSEMSVAGPPAKSVRTLSDELVIQSLILGRLMEEDELVVETAS